MVEVLEVKALRQNDIRRCWNRKNETDLPRFVGRRGHTAAQIRGGSATCDLAGTVSWRLLFGWPYPVRRVPGVALCPGL